MNKKQLVVAWIMAIIIVILLGFESNIVHDLLRPDLPGEEGLFWYGHLLFSVMMNTKFLFLFDIAHAKFQIIAGLLIMGSLLIYTLKNKKK